jgi:hypothetical protein
MIIFDNASSGKPNVSDLSFSVPHTITSLGGNRCLVVSVLSNIANLIVSYGGVVMRESRFYNPLLANTSSGFDIGMAYGLYTYVLMDPPTGDNDIVVSLANSETSLWYAGAVASSYTNVKQSHFIDDYKTEDQTMGVSITMSPPDGISDFLVVSSMALDNGLYTVTPTNAVFRASEPTVAACHAVYIWDSTHTNSSWSTTINSNWAVEGILLIGEVFVPCCDNTLYPELVGGYTNIDFYKNSLLRISFTPEGLFHYQALLAVGSFYYAPGGYGFSIEDGIIYGIVSNGTNTSQVKIVDLNVSNPGDLKTFQCEARFYPNDKIMFSVKQPHYISGLSAGTEIQDSGSQIITDITNFPIPIYQSDKMETFYMKNKNADSHAMWIHNFEFFQFRR